MLLEMRNVMMQTLLIVRCYFITLIFKMMAAPKLVKLRKVLHVMNNQVYVRQNVVIALSSLETRNVMMGI